MYNRNWTLLLAVLGLGAGSPLLAQQPAQPDPVAQAQTKEQAAPPDVTTPAGALQAVTEGAGRFAAGKLTHPHLNLDRIKETTAGQKPFVTVLTCSDSRVPPEFIFDQGLGDVFVVRVAGNVASTDEIGTIEYGAGHLNTPLLVVMGHTKCGAVTAVAQNTVLHGSIPKLIEPIKAAIPRAKNHECAACNHDFVTRCIYENVWVSIENLISRSEEVRLLLVQGKLKVVGAVYDIATGQVQWLGEHKNQAKLIVSARGGHENEGAEAPEKTEKHAVRSVSSRRKR